MTIENILTLVETIAVIATLFYVAKQIKQSNDLQQSSILMETTDSFTNFVLAGVENNHMLETYIKALSGEKAEGVNKMRIAILALATIRIFENMYLQNQKNSFHSDAWPGYRIHMLTVLNSPGLTRYISERKSFFNPEFLKFIEENTSDHSAWDQYLKEQ